jgi:hypothetical protein
MRAAAALLAVALAGSGCAATDTRPAASADCVDDALAAYRLLAAPTRAVIRGYGRAKGTVRAARSARNAYVEASGAAARVAASCAEDGGVGDPECRAALADLATVLRDARASVRLETLDDVRDRSGGELEQRRARLEGAAAGVAGCSG